MNILRAGSLRVEWSTSVPSHIVQVKGELSMPISLTTECSSSLNDFPSFRFSIDFRRGASAPREKRDIALHMSCKLSFAQQGSDFVLNSQLKGKSGTEIKVREVPFAWGEHFDLMVMCDRAGFKVRSSP